MQSAWSQIVWPCFCHNIACRMSAAIFMLSGAAFRLTPPVGGFFVSSPLSFVHAAAAFVPLLITTSCRLSLFFILKSPLTVFDTLRCARFLSLIFYSFSFVGVSYCCFWSCIELMASIAMPVSCLRHRNQLCDISVHCTKFIVFRLAMRPQRTKW